MIQHRPLVIAHRGAKGEAPENTLAAFRLGLEQGCDAAELDIHMSRDGELMVCHDATIDRTTSGSGRIREMTADELRAHDAGAWFGGEFAGERIPLLQEVFELFPADVMINVEIKDYGDDVQPRLIELLARYNRFDSVIVSSFNHKCLARLKQLAPDVKIGLLYGENLVNHAGLADTAGFPVYSLHPNFRQISAEDVRDAVARGLKVFPYTVNNKEHWNIACEAGVTGIITDFPGELRQFLR
jgi:glycerophosphoryl diester phosphodiesterase